MKPGKKKPIAYLHFSRYLEQSCKAAIVLMVIKLLSVINFCLFKVIT